MILNKYSDKKITQFDNQKNLVLKKYLPVSELDKKWGFTINSAGFTQIGKNADYPSKGHPGSHMFSWETGRVLEEYHFVLITEGQGVFENRKTGLKRINSGDGFLLFPGEWHRYKPDKETGWTENWVGFTGQIPDIVLSDSSFPGCQNIIPNCASMLVQNLFATLFHLVSEEPFGFQRTASGVCLQLIAEIYTIQNASESSKLASSLITKAKHLMHKKIEENIDFQLFAKNNQISYSKFRSDFKNQTGFAPQNYFLLMKIEKAKELLKTTSLQTKQIAFCLGFKSDHYFCRFFKQKTGFSPTQFRSKHKIQMKL